MNSITVYYLEPGAHIFGRLAQKNARPMASLAMGRTYVGIAVKGKNRSFRFTSLAHQNMDGDGKFKPLGDPANDLFDSSGDPLPRSLYKSVKGVVVEDSAVSHLASLQVQTTGPEARAALAYVLEVQKTPPDYRSAGPNCAMFAADVARAGGVDLAVLAKRTRIRSPIDIWRAFQTASTALTRMHEGLWNGWLEGRQAVLTSSVPGLFNEPTRRNPVNQLPGARKPNLAG